MWKTVTANGFKIGVMQFEDKKGQIFLNKAKKK